MQTIRLLHSLQYLLGDDTHTSLLLFSTGLLGKMSLCLTVGFLIT